MNQPIKQRIEQVNNGQVPTGYKETEFGIFPCDWVTDKTFGDLFSFNGGLGKSREELSENGIEYLHYGDMHRSDFNIASLEQYSKLPKYDTKIKGDESFLMQDGDVAFLDASEDLEGTSRSVLIDNPENKPFIAGLHIIYGKPRGKELSKYYKQYLTRPEYIKKQFKKLASGFKVYGLNRNTITGIKCAYPKSTAEQEKIAEILMKWDKVIELQDNYIEKLKLKKKAIIDNIFNDNNKGNHFFCDLYLHASEGGTPSTSKTEYYDKGTIPFVKIEHLQNKYITSIDSYITDVGLKNSGAWLIPSNNLIFSNGASIGEVSINKIPVTTKQGILGIIPSKNISLEYFYYLLSSDYFLTKIKRITTKGTMSTAYLKDIDKISLFVHPIQQQTIIGESLGLIDNAIEMNMNKYDKIKKQRKALQQYLLNGIVRVEV